MSHMRELKITKIKNHTQRRTAGKRPQRNIGAVTRMVTGVKETDKLTIKLSSRLDC